jgi:ArsR family transcriptional regulator
LNLFLKILENPIRRNIVERLSQEPNYPLQLSKDLGLGQQLVAKHLKIMEDSGLLKSAIKSSPAGPKRRTYELSKSFSITLDIAPYLFKEEIVSFDVEPEKSQLNTDLVSLVERRNELAGFLETSDKMSPCAEILSDIDEKLRELEEERLLLLYIRNSVMKEASKTISQVDDAEARRVLHQAVDEHDSSVKYIAQTLNLREDRVQEAIKKLKKELDSDFFE